ncbi:hypothetical protein N7478_004256 [Penicillium angulare]|uniref:uncharacterized protein n=1 Tax=Penicillium angulare TaxID=116970 RepID=UPI00253F9601|nr:uncharacterized protein N7478_004256 [Penicillium angulare]KAJ5278884.1 hypothetical protein N7478_004256 [Penicillium angulare]
MPSNEKRSSRITVACGSCRTKKQKHKGQSVDSVSNTIGHVNGLNNYAGPAKGHVESLEHRLQITEGLLLRLLPEISDARLKSILPDQTNSGLSYAPLARLEKRGIEDWSQYPLDSFKNIRGWQQACIGQSSDDNIYPHEPVTSTKTRASRGIKRKLPMEIESHSPPQKREILPAGLKQADQGSIPKKRTLSNSHEELPQSSQPFHWEMQPDSDPPAPTKPKTISQFFW